MNIGIPKERRSFEYRVGLAPAMVQILTRAGHSCFVEHDAGLGAGFSDKEYEQAGGKIVYSSHEVFGRADLLLKVSRPMMEELEWIQPGATIAGLLHLASARRDKIEKLFTNKISAIAYEQIQLPDGTVVVRKPLSQIGGRLAAQIGGTLLQSDSGGKGILLGGIAGVPPAEVAVIGAGVAGTCAAKSFLAAGAHVTVLDSDLTALQHIYELNPHIVTMIATQANIARTCSFADIVVGAAYRTQERAPILITREMVRSMKPRSVIIDISVDEGGNAETSRPTTLERPYFLEEGVIHYCVPNIPSSVARTSTYAFLNAAFPYIQEIANKGLVTAIADNPALEKAVNTLNGEPRHISGFAAAI